jgi:NAD(P)-dependent dehydrogenase (short-subunit alcohol dehydrogenase family)
MSPADQSPGGNARSAAPAATAYSAQYPSLRSRGVYITGGSSGIGADLVRAFAAQHAQVAFNGRDEAAGHGLCDEVAALGQPRPLFEPVDVTDVDALCAHVKRAEEQLGGIEVLVNNVGNDQRREFETVSREFFDGMVAVNLRSHFFATQAVLPGMKARGRGSIVNIGSISWMIKDSGYAAYATMKSASAGLTRSLARELGAHRIRINHLAPGWVMTPKQVAMWLDEAGERAIAENQCLPDKLMPADVAAMCLFLAADDSRMITAQDFIVDAGWV